MDLRLPLTGLALPAAASTAAAGNVTLVSTGTVSGGAMSSGPLAGAGFGDTVTMTFDVITPGTPVTPTRFRGVCSRRIDPRALRRPCPPGKE